MFEIHGIGMVERLNANGGTNGIVTSCMNV